MEEERIKLLDTVQLEVRRRYPDMDESSVRTLAGYAMDGWFEHAYRAIGEELGLEDDDGPGGTFHKFDWASGNELTFAAGDLKINPKTGRTFAHEDREEVSGRRWAMLTEMAAFVAEETAK